MEPAVPASGRVPLPPRYEIIRPLGHGAWATVYEVKDRAVEGARRAVKVVRVPSEDPDLGMDALREEFRMAARFRHPNLVRYVDLDVTDDDQVAFLCMELVSGGQFGATRVDWRSACTVVGHLLRALQFLHESGWVHGDVKPANVLWHAVEAGPEVKLLDYNLAFRPDALSRTSSRGTLRYLAPEVLSGRQPSPRSDLYAVGVMLFEACTGRVLFEGTPVEVASQHLLAPVDSPDLEVEGALNAFAGRLLAKSPDGRFDTARDALIALAGIVEPVGPPDTAETMLGRVRSVSLVERPAELRRVEALVDEVRGGAARWLLLQGAPHSGAERVVREAANLCRAHGLATCRVGGGDDALRRVQEWACAQSSAPEASLTECLRALAISRGVAIFVEDAVRAPKGLLNALECILAGGDARLLAVFSSEHCEDLTEALSEAAPAVRDAEKMVLTDPAESALRELIDAALPRKAPPSLPGRILRACAPRPRLILHTIERVFQCGSVSVASDGHVSEPESLTEHIPEELVAAAVSVLDDGGLRAEVLNNVALAREGLETAVLYALIPSPADQVLCATRECECMGLLYLAHGEPACWRIVHRGLEPVVAGRLTQQQLTERHNRLADALASAENADSVRGMLREAWHRFAGSSPARGTDLLISAVRESPDLGEGHIACDVLDLAVQHGVQHRRSEFLREGVRLLETRGLYRRAIGLIEEALAIPDLTQGELAHFSRKRAEIRAAMGMHGQAEEDVERVMAMDASVKDVRLEQGFAELVRSDTLQMCAQYDEAVRCAEKALRIAREHEDARLLVSGHFAVGSALLRSGDPQEALRANLAAFWACHRAKLAGMVAPALLRLAWSAVRSGRDRVGRGLMEHAVSVAKSRGQVIALADAHYQRASRLAVTGHQPDAATEYERVLALLREADATSKQCASLLNLAQTYNSQGYMDIALACAEDGIDICAAGTELEYGLKLAAAAADFGIGNVSRAEERVCEVLENTNSLASPRVEEIAKRYRAHILRFRGRYDEAEEVQREAIAVAVKAGLPGREAMGMVRLAEILLCSGRLDEALGCAVRGLELSERRPGIRLAAHVLKGRVLLAKGLKDQARTVLASAHRDLLASPQREEAFEACLGLGECHASLGHPRFATHYYSEGLARVDEMAGRIRDRVLRTTFLTDPRRMRLYEAISKLTGDTGPVEAGVSDPVKLARKQLAAFSATRRVRSQEPETEDPFRVLVRVAGELSSELDVNKVLSVAGREIVGVFEAERVFIVEMSPDGSMNFRFARAFDGSDVPHPESELSRAVVQQVMDTVKPVLVANATEDPRFAGVSSVANLQLHAVMAAPLNVAGEVLGVVYADSRMFADLFDDQKLDMMAMLANQVAIALRNAELFSELSSTRAQLAQAERFRALGEVATFVAHEIKNPLASMGIFVGMLQDRYDDPRVRETVTDVFPQELERLRRAAEQISSYARPTDLLLVPLEVVPLLESALGSVQGELEKWRVVVQREFARSVPSILADGQHLREVFVNLLKNAVEAMEGVEERTIRLTVRSGRRGTVEVLVADSGPGVQEEELASIFKPFHTTKPGGSGVGLAYCQKIVQEHGGILVAAESDLGGLLFRMSLPIAGA